MTEQELRAEDPGLIDLPARFELEARLGRGGMATVYLATDATTQTRVALKVLHPHLRDDELVVARFRREIAAARRIAHDNIIRIHDLIETPRLACLVLEHQPGGDLKQLIRRRGALPVDEALALTRQLLAGLAVAHRAGVVHRDIKPHNVLVDADGVAKIADFGLARVDDLIGVTTHTMSLGTPEYMAPELLGSPIVDGRADIYGVGVVLFELLTGKLPFRASTPLALLQLHQNEAPPNPCALNPELPAWLGEVVRRAMAKAPEDRFSTATEMRDALETAAAVAAGTGGATLTTSRSCPKCAAPLLPGTTSCVECGTERVYISEQPQGGGRLIITRRPWFMPTSSGDDDFLTFADKARIHATLTRLGGRVSLDEAGLDQRLREPPVVLAQRLSADDGEALVRELRSQGIDRVRYVPSKRQLGLMLQLGRFGRNALVSMLLALLVLGLTGVESFALWVAVTVASTIAITHVRAKLRGAPIVRFDAGLRGVRQSRDALIEKATKTFALVRSERLKQMTRRILSRGMQLRELFTSSDRYSDQMLANLELAMTTSLDTAGRIAVLEATVGDVDVAEIHERMQQLEQRSADATNIQELDEIAEQQHALRVELSELDEQQAEIMRLSGQLLDTSSRFAKLLREHERGAEDGVTSMSMILGDLELELAAHREGFERVGLDEDEP
jgi:serine/threonine protein kinase